VSKQEQKTEQGIYIFGSRKYGWYKIGFSTDVDSRFKQISSGVPFTIERVCFWATKHQNYFKERYLHARLQHKRLKGEWFALTEDDLKNCEALVQHGDLEMAQFRYPLLPVLPPDPRTAETVATIRHYT